jgi:hypothetical protein
MAAFADKQKRTYRAEWDTFTSKSVNQPVRMSTAKSLIGEYLPGWEVRRSKTPDTALCFAYERRIVLSTDTPIWIVCHEIAHGLVQEKGLPLGHHEVFRRYYIDVCHESMSPYWSKKLRSNFDVAHLKYLYPEEVQPSLLLRLFGMLRT